MRLFPSFIAFLAKMVFALPQITHILNIHRHMLSIHILTVKDADLK